MIPIFDAMLEEQQSQGTLWTPSKVMRTAGEVALNARAAHRRR